MNLNETVNYLIEKTMKDFGLNVDEAKRILTKALTDKKTLDNLELMIEEIYKEESLFEQEQ